MKVVYVVVSSERDTYYEQALISLISLRRHNPLTDVLFIVDSGTAATLTGKRAMHEKYGAKAVSVDCPQEYSNKERSRFLKTSMYRYVDDDFLYIDGDTVVCGNLDEISGCGADIALVRDLHQSLSENVLRKAITDRVKKLKFHVCYGGLYFNSGVMWVKKSARSERFFELWEQLWKESLVTNVCFDQTSLNEANYRMDGIVTELDGIWNCQVSNNRSPLRFLEKAKILHYFSDGPFGGPYRLSDFKIQKSVLDGEHSELDEILRNPKSMFRDGVYISGNLDAMRLQQTMTFALLLSVYRNFPPVFGILDFSIRAVTFIPRRIRKAVRKITARMIRETS